jgi:hypothetical protein
MDELKLVEGLLKSKGIKLKFRGSIPSVYLLSINSILIKEKRASDHGWLLGYINLSVNGTTVTSDSLSDLIILINKLNEENKLH